MTTPAHDLSKLRIDRDTLPPGLRRAFVRNLALALVALIVIATVVVLVKRGSAAPVQVALATATDGVSSSAGGASVTANGYVVARTRASVSAKVAGRLAYLSVSEGSVVRRGEVIARLENADYEAQVTQAEANLASARAER